MKLSILSFFAILLIGCTTQSGFNRSEFLQRPERKLSTYNAAFEPNIENRVKLAPTEVIQYLNRMDSTDRYVPYSLTENELKIFAHYITLLPPRYRELIQKYVVGVYFIENFAGGGMSDFLFDSKGNMFIALYFNPDLMKRSVEEWIDFRENSPFLPDTNVSIKVESERSYLGLLHTLVHESSHIYDYYNHITPYIQPFFKDDKAPISTIFTDGIWKDYRNPQSEFGFLRKTKYSGYGLGGKIPASNAVALYSQLSATPFSSLYGSLSWAEDFAETVTWYYLKEKLAVTYKVTVLDRGKVVAQFEPITKEKDPARYSVIASIME